MRVLVSAACAASMLMFAGGAAAQGKGSGPKPKVTSGTAAQSGGHATHAQPVKTTTKSAPTQNAHATSHPTTHTKTTDTTKVTGQAHVTAKSDNTKASGHPHNSTTTGTTTGSTTTTTTTGTTTTGTTLTPVQQKLQRNTNLASKLQSRLPAGTDLNTAAAGFRNLGQFVAAVNVSNNLGLDFATLKTAMVVDGKSLGQAIQAQKTTVDGTTIAVHAERDADAEIKSAESSTRTTGKPKTKTDGHQ